MIKKILLTLTILGISSIAHAATTRYVQISTSVLTQQSGNSNIQGATISTATISSATISNTFGVVTDKSTSTHSGTHTFTGTVNIAGSIADSSTNTWTGGNTYSSYTNFNGSQTFTGSTVAYNAAILNGTMTDNSTTTATGSKSFRSLTLYSLSSAMVPFLTTNGLVTGTTNFQFNGTNAFTLYGALQTDNNIFFKSNSNGTILSPDQTEKIQIIDSGIVVTTVDGLTVNGPVNLAGANSIKGTTTNDNASSGYVGQHISSAVVLASAVSSSGTNQWFDVAQISLTAGDWDVSMVLAATANGATVTAATGGIGTVTGNDATGIVAGDNRLNFLPPTSVVGDTGLTIAAWRVSISGTATYYLKSLMTFSVATPKSYGRISARRVR